MIKRGFTMVELLIVVAIAILLSAVVFSSLLSFRKNQALEKDTELVVQLLNQARSQTLSSKGATVYGVHFASSQVILFSGSTYAAAASGNQAFDLTSTDTILTITLTGGGSDVLFQRLTGETTQNGTIVISSSGISRTKTVTIYRTGVIDSN
jgi:prepilin-type N-terminal cleavage/methylation domain-containing protein